MSVDHQTRPNRVEIPNDILVRDEDFCRKVLGRCARRTAKRYECEGLSYIPIGGRKFRPLKAVRTSWASRTRKARTCCAKCWRYVRSSSSAAGQPATGPWPGTTRPAGMAASSSITASQPFRLPSRTGKRRRKY
jgi:hypothetical protein